MTGEGGVRSIPSLDGIRAAAIVLVFFSHAVPDDFPVVVPGGFGVTTFFFLSGYLITTLLRVEHEAAGAVSLRGFYLRRLLRIHPPLLAMLGLAAVLAAADLLPGQFDPVALGAAVLQLSNYLLLARGEGALPPGVGVLWSLSVEEHFYLVFPVAYSFLAGRRVSRRAMGGVLLAVCAVVLAWRLALSLELGASVAHLRLATDARLDSILYGCVLAVVANPVLDRPRVSRRVLTLWLLPLGLAGLAASHAIPGERLREALKYSVQGVAFLPVFAAAIRYPDFLPFRLLNARPVAFLGVLSYGFYLVHAVVLRALEDGLGIRRGSAALYVAGFAGSLLLAWLLHLGVERPLGALRRSWRAAATAKPRAAAPVTAPDAAP